MKKIVLCLLVYITSLTAFAQPNTDSLAYQLQRKKINSMLGLRRQKFGQYDESLNRHTGIFGLQTKKDIRRSNDILMDIVKTDNDIFTQLKILLDYRTFAQTQVQTQSKDIENSNLGYMTTINKLRNELDKVKQAAEEERKQQETLKMILFFIIGLTMLVSILYIIRKKNTAKA